MKIQLTLLAPLLLTAALSVQTIHAQGTRPADANRPSEARTLNAERMRVSELIGKDLKNPQGETLGRIQDLVLDLRSGRTPLAIVALDQSPLRVAVPLARVQTTGRGANLTLSATRDQLQEAAREPARAWDRFRRETWARDLNGFYGQPPRVLLGDVADDREYTRSPREDRSYRRSTEGSEREYKDREPKQGLGAHDLMNLDDRRLEQQVHARLTREGLTTASAPIDVRASDGVVTLSGRVPTENARGQLIRLVEGLHGVKRVIDDLVLPYQ